MLELHQKENQSPKGKQPRRFEKYGSIRMKILLIYSIFSLANLLFFSIIIVENQLDLLIDNFSLKSGKLGEILGNDLKKINLVLPENFEESSVVPEDIKRILKLNGVDSFHLFGKEGILASVNSSMESDGKEANEINKKIQEIEVAPTSSSYYTLQSEKGGITRFLIPLALESGHYIYFQLGYFSLLDSLNSIVFQLALALGWGVLFHFLFGLYLNRKIFKRISSLEEASGKMAEGALATRVTFYQEIPDELHRMGVSFNDMAEKIENSVANLMKLNKQIQRELEIGKQVQELLLPTKNVLSDYSPEIYYRPMREVSGDIYNFFAFDKKYKGVFLADATGHGISAALVTSIIQMSLNTITKDTANPGKIVNHISNNLFSILRASFFASGIFVLFDCNDKLYFCNAGHNPPILLRKDSKKIILMESTAALLGIGSEAASSVRSIKVNPGDRILLYTDGIVEGKDSAGNMFSLERLESLLSQGDSLSLYELRENIQKDFDSFCKEIKDDCTFILLEVPNGN
ncbi:hypothetical protein CH373_11300 [Leptospira perolatii]|uniref:HAMP domain-containing protein n=1 Tax=Leptospira perolatii TaxID=2023191 RepID=A0A2M9ZM55_9LEPT|nr:SpoIIE family protein phosphatase [Leptospira perolatii]PJZ69711.1 hypothetical protein CH360_08935 [Leptospira perolatii]PJZ73074.1 hypothetical protein CH373_11300 [Leptospira perolatii]